MSAASSNPEAVRRCGRRIRIKIEHDNIEVEITGENAMLIVQSLVEAAVFGGGKSMWHLQQKLSLKKRDGIWYITRSVASTYR
jgi:hypothetical protein